MSAKLLADGTWREDYDSAWYAVAKLELFETEPRTLWIARLFEHETQINSVSGNTPADALDAARESRADMLKRRATIALREGKPTPEPAPPFVPPVASTATETRDVLDLVKELPQHGISTHVWNLIHALALHLGHARVTHAHNAEELMLLREYYDANEHHAYKGRIDAARSALQRVLGR